MNSRIYHRQQFIHLCCLQKMIRWRYLSRRDVTRSLDSDVHCCLPTSVRSLRRQNFSAFISSLNRYLLKFRLVPTIQSVVKVPNLNVSHPFPFNLYVEMKWKKTTISVGNRKPAKTHQFSHAFVCINVKIWWAEWTMAAGLSENGLWLNLITREHVLRFCQPVVCACTILSTRGG